MSPKWKVEPEYATDITSRTGTRNNTEFPQSTHGHAARKVGQKIGCL